MSKITQTDTATEKSYEMDGFNPELETTKFSYTSSRVAIANYNHYNNNNKPKIIGYYTDWSQYDGRLDDDQIPGHRGRGVNLAHLDPLAYDKLIIGFAGILGDLGEKSRAIAAAASSFSRSREGEVTFIDAWGDCQSYRNCGFPGYVDTPMPASFNQKNTMGILGGLRDLQKKAKDKGHELILSFSVGGWTMSEAFHKLTKDSSLRALFCTSIVDIFKRFPMFTEIDIDWEYPGAAGNGNPFGDEDSDNYVTLMHELVTALQSAGLHYVRISIAASADIKKLEKTNIPELLVAGLYGIHLMTYDFFGTPWAARLAHHTNLFKTPNTEFSIDEAVNWLLGIGVDPGRIIIGYAGYTRNAKGAKLDSLSPLDGTYDNSGTTSTSGTFESGTTEWCDLIYNYLDLEAQKGKNGFELYTDEIANADYLYNAQSKFFISLETPRTVNSKAKYVLEKGLGGMMTWTADQDNGLLVNAAREGFGCPVIEEKIHMAAFYFSGVNVSPCLGDEPPVAVINNLQPVAPGGTVQVSGAHSYDPNDKLLTYQWVIPEDLTVNDPLTEQIINITVPTDSLYNSYTLELTVENGSKSHSTVAVLAILGGLNIPPVALITGATMVTAKEQALLSGADSYDSDGTIVSYFWDVPDSVSATTLNKPVLHYTAPDVSVAQTLNFTLRVTDNADATGFTTCSVRVNPASSYPAWDEKKVYNKGDRVSYQGKNWEAKWWTQGTAPGTAEAMDAWPWHGLCEFWLL